jgi:hypothetical protein
MIPRLYPPEDEHRILKLSIEYFLIALSLYAILGNYIMAMIVEPGFSHKDPGKKLTEKSFNLLKEKTLESNDFKFIQDDPTHSDKLNLDTALKEFQDAFGYSMYCDKCKKFRYPRTHH